MYIENSMKILFDLSGHDSIYSGVTIYALRTLSGFVKNGYKDVTILCEPKLYDYVTNTFPDYESIKCESLKVCRFRLVVKGYYWSRLVNQSDADVVFSPHPSCLGYLFTKKKIVQTVHDLQPLKVYKGLPRVVYALLFPFILLRSERIITISDYVKKEIERVYPFISRSKIETIYNSVAVDDTYYGTSPLQARYLLYVSSLLKYKNVLTLLKAYNLIKEQINRKLVIIGRVINLADDSWEKEALPFIQKNHLERFIIHISQPLADDELSRYFQFTDLFIHPSLLEGFGYTPIEAAIHKVPVLTTKETALYETTMGLLNYYSPATDEHALAEKILLLLENKVAPEELERISETLKKQYDYCNQSRKIYDLLLKTFTSGSFMGR